MRLHTIAMTLAFLGLSLLATASPARAEWLKAESEHFIVYGDTSRGAITDYTRKVERFAAMLRLFLPPKNDDLVSPKLTIYMADGASDLNQVWPGVGNSIGGFYSYSDQRIYAVVNRRQDESDRTLFHEYAHHYMFQYHNAAYPGWFVEGFAEYFAPSDMTFGRIRYGLWRPGRMNSLTDTSEWIPMDEVLKSRPQRRTHRAMAAYYAQAWALTHYMLGSPERQRQLSAYLIAVNNGTDPVDALEQHVGRTPQELTRDLRSYLARGITTYTLQQALPNADVSVTALPRSTRDFIWLDLRAARGFTDDDDQSALLAQIAQKAAQYPGDRLAHVTQAKWLLKADKPAEAEAALTPIIASQPADAEAQWLMAIALMDQVGDDTDDDMSASLNRRARSHLAQAYEADPTDYRVYSAMARNRRDAPNYPTDNDVVILESAYRMAPQLASTAIPAANAMMHRQRYREAVMILAPIAHNPHGGEGLNEVRAMLADARSKAGLGTTSEDEDDLPPPPPEDDESPVEDAG